MLFTVDNKSDIFILCFPLRKNRCLFKRVILYSGSFSSLETGRVCHRVTYVTPKVFFTHIKIADDIKSCSLHSFLYGVKPCFIILRLPDSMNSIVLVFRLCTVHVTQNVQFEHVI